MPGINLKGHNDRVVAFYMSIGLDTLNSLNQASDFQP